MIEDKATNMDENNKVYIITKGSYSDYHICAVTLNKDTAKKLAKKYSEDEWDKALIEEYVLDDFTNCERYMYRVGFYERGIDCTFDEYEHTEKIIYNNSAWTGVESIIVYVKAKDEEHAIKIAQDRRAEYLAKKQGII